VGNGTNLRIKDLLGLVTRVKKKKKVPRKERLLLEAEGEGAECHLQRLDADLELGDQLLEDLVQGLLEIKHTRGPAVGLCLGASGHHRGGACI